MSVPRQDDGFDRVSYRHRASTGRDIGSRVPAIITAVVAAAFLGFAFFPSRPTANAGTSSVNAAAAPHALPTSPPPRARTAQPAAPERIANLQPIVEPINKAATEFLRQTGRMPDPYRPMDREAARQATRKLNGVRSAFWIDRQNLMVMVDGSERRSMATIDQDRPAQTRPHSGLTLSKRAALLVRRLLRGVSARAASHRVSSAPMASRRAQCSSLAPSSSTTV